MRYNVLTMKHITRSFAVVLSFALTLSSLPASALAGGQMAAGKMVVFQPGSMPVGLNPNSVSMENSAGMGDRVAAPLNVGPGVSVLPVIQPDATLKPEVVATPDEVVAAETLGAKVQAENLSVGTKAATPIKSKGLSGLLKQFKADVLKSGDVNWDNAAKKPKFQVDREDWTLIKEKAQLADAAVVEADLPGRYSAYFSGGYYGYQAFFQLNADRTLKFRGEPNDPDDIYSDAPPAFKGEGKWEFREGKLSLNLTLVNVGPFAESDDPSIQTSLVMDFSGVNNGQLQSGDIRIPVASRLFNDGEWTLTRHQETALSMPAFQRTIAASVNAGTLSRLLQAADAPSKEPTVSPEMRLRILGIFNKLRAKGFPKIRWQAEMPVGVRYVRVPLAGAEFAKGYQYDAFIPIGPLTNPTAPTQDPNKAEYFILRKAGGPTGKEVLFSKPISLKTSDKGGSASFLGIRSQEKKNLPEGLDLDEPPSVPDPKKAQGVSLESVELEGSANAEVNLFTSGSIVLPVNPADKAGFAKNVEAALRNLVDADPASYQVSSKDLATVHVRYIEGEGNQADKVFAYFKQKKNDLLVHGTGLKFTVMIIKGQVLVKAVTANLYPNVAVNTSARKTDEELKAKALERLDSYARRHQLTLTAKLLNEEIVYLRGAWRAANIYFIDGVTAGKVTIPVMIAVDQATGDAFAWDPSFQTRTNGEMAGRGVEHGPVRPGAVVSEIPLAFLEVKLGGKTYVTDQDGRFSLNSSFMTQVKIRAYGSELAVLKSLHGAAGFLHLRGLQKAIGSRMERINEALRRIRETLPPSGMLAAQGVELSATLAGPYVRIQDSSGKTLSVKVQVKPDKDGNFKVVFNPDSNLNDENALAQVMAFYNTNESYNFLKKNKVTNEQMDRQSIRVVTNVDDECNAYYTPGSPSLNFFKQSYNCVNTSYDTVNRHEYGHYWDDMTGGIINGGLSEGWGDTVSMYQLNNPIIGEHFLKHPGQDGVDYIRTGENDYQYQGEDDEVHNIGQAWGGFNWKLRKAVMAKMGDAAGAAWAEAIVLPTMFAKAANVPAAMTQVLLAAMDKEGNIVNEAEIRAAAAAHGVTLSDKPTKGDSGGGAQRPVSEGPVYLRAAYQPVDHVPGSEDVLSPEALKYWHEQNRRPGPVDHIKLSSQLKSASADMGPNETNQIKVGDKVLNVINGVGYIVTVKALFADGTALVGYGSMFIRDSFTPVSGLVKQVPRVGEMSVGDKVLNVINGVRYIGTVKALFADGTALVGYGSMFIRDSFTPVSGLVKMDKEGNIVNEAEIRAAAAAHGVTLADKPTKGDFAGVGEVLEKYRSQLMAIPGVTHVTYIGGHGSGPVILVTFESEEAYQSAVKAGKLPAMLEGYKVGHTIADKPAKGGGVKAMMALLATGLLSIVATPAFAAAPGVVMKVTMGGGIGAIIGFALGFSYGRRRAPPGGVYDFSLLIAAGWGLLGAAVLGVMGSIVGAVIS